MKKILILAGAMVLAGAGFGEGYPQPDAGRIDEIAGWLPREPRAPGPRIGERERWAKIAADPEAKKVLKRAEDILKENVPECPDEWYLDVTRNGNRTRYEKPYHRRVWNLDMLTLAECIENKGRFIAKTVEYVEAILEERTWTMPAHDLELDSFYGRKNQIDLGAAMRAAQLGVLCDWLGDKLPGEAREKVYRECRRRVLDPYLAVARNPRPENTVKTRHWWYYGGNNWNSVCNSCVVRAALALVPGRRERAEFVESAERTVPFALAGYTDDGYCSEGMGYWNYGYGHHIFMALAIRHATGGKVDLFADAKNKAIMRYPYKYRMLDWKSPRFSDGGGDASPELLALLATVDGELACRRAGQTSLWRSGPGVVGLLAEGRDWTPAGEGGADAAPLRSVFGEAQVYMFRAEKTEGGRRLAMALKGGHNAELHNHNDVGTYTIMLDGVEMCGDPGAEVYTRRTFSKDRYVSKVLNSYGHPVPLPAGGLQLTGREAAAKVLSAEFGEGCDTVKLDLTAAYGVGTLKRLVRTVKFERGAGRIAVEDEFEFSKPERFETAVMTYCGAERVGGEGEWELRDVKSGLRMGVKAEAGFGLRAGVEEIENPGKPTVKRLAFAGVEPVASGVVRVVFGGGR